MFRLTRGGIGCRGVYFKNSSTKYIYFLLSFHYSYFSISFILYCSFFFMRFLSFCLCVSARSFRIRYLFHIRIGNVTQGNECLLDGLRRCPTEYVMRSTCLVVSTGFTTATKRLLSHNRSRRLIIDVEIAGSCFKLFQSAINKISAMRNCNCNKIL